MPDGSATWPKATPRNQPCMVRNTACTDKGESGHTDGNPHAQGAPHHTTKAANALNQPQTERTKNGGTTTKAKRGGPQGRTQATRTRNTTQHNTMRTPQNGLRNLQQNLDERQREKAPSTPAPSNPPCPMYLKTRRETTIHAAPEDG